MEIDLKQPPRRFVAAGVEVADCGRLILAPDEQVTFVTEAGGEYDVARKEWGFYATPSLNGRLSRFGLRGVLVANPQDKLFVMLVEVGKEDSFFAYLSEQGSRVIAWLDGTEATETLVVKLAK